MRRVPERLQLILYCLAGRGPREKTWKQKSGLRNKLKFFLPCSCQKLPTIFLDSYLNKTHRSEKTKYKWLAYLSISVPDTTSATQGSPSVVLEVVDD